MKLTTPPNLDIIGEGNCAFPFTMENDTIVLNLKMTEDQNNFWKYNEDKTIKLIILLNNLKLKLLI